MVEIFSTDVRSQTDADFLLGELAKQFPMYEVNFDLEDCDNILRVASFMDEIDTLEIVALLNGFGFCIHILADTA